MLGGVGAQRHSKRVVGDRPTDGPDHLSPSVGFKKSVRSLSTVCCTGRSRLVDRYGAEAGWAAKDRHGERYAARCRRACVVVQRQTQSKAKKGRRRRRVSSALYILFGMDNFGSIASAAWGRLGINRSPNSSGLDWIGHFSRSYKAGGRTTTVEISIMHALLAIASILPFVK